MSDVTPDLTGGAIGKRIKQRREAAGLSRQQLATLIGVSRMAVHHWEEGGHVPGVGVLCAVASALGTSLDTLLGLPGASYENGFDDGWNACAKRVAVASGRSTTPLVGE